MITQVGQVLIYRVNGERRVLIQLIKGHDAEREKILSIELKAPELIFVHPGLLDETLIELHRQQPSEDAQQTPRPPVTFPSSPFITNIRWNYRSIPFTDVKI